MLKAIGPTPTLGILSEPRSLASDASTVIFATAGRFENIWEIARAAWTGERRAGVSVGSQYWMMFQVDPPDPGHRSSG